MPSILLSQRCGFALQAMMMATMGPVRHGFPWQWRERGISPGATQNRFHEEMPRRFAPQNDGACCLVRTYVLFQCGNSTFSHFTTDLLYLQGGRSSIPARNHSTLVPFLSHCGFSTRREKLGGGGDAATPTLPNPDYCPNTPVLPTPFTPNTRALAK